MLKNMELLKDRYIIINIQCRMKKLSFITWKNHEFRYIINIDIDDCKITERGLEYRGNRQTTRDGIQCQRWDSTTPHKPYPKISFPASSLSAQENYCRNPDYEPGPWCYTMDPHVRWQRCEVPFCFNGMYQYINRISLMKCTCSFQLLLQKSNVIIYK